MKLCLRAHACWHTTHTHKQTLCVFVLFLCSSSSSKQPDSHTQTRMFSHLLQPVSCPLHMLIHITCCTYVTVLLTTHLHYTESRADFSWQVLWLHHKNTSTSSIRRRLDFMFSLCRKKIYGCCSLWLLLRIVFIIDSPINYFLAERDGYGP